MEGSDEVCRFGDTTLSNSGSNSQSTGLSTFATALGKNKEPYIDSILPRSSFSSIPVSVTASSTISIDSLVTDQMLDASSSAFYPPAGERDLMVQSLLEEARSKELLELQDVDTFLFAKLAQSNRELEKAEAIDSHLQTTIKVPSSHLPKATLNIQDNCSSSNYNFFLKRFLFHNFQRLSEFGAGFSGEKKDANCSPLPCY